MGLFFLTSDGLHGTDPDAATTSRAFLRVNGILDQFFADPGRAALFPDVGLEFVSKVTDGGQDGVRGCLAQPTQ